jgi:hypothetical protein
VRASDEEVLYELLEENEYSDISESKYSNDSEINVNILSCGERSVISDDKNVSDSSSVQLHIWAKSCGE